jgi:hypothetical protein
MALALPAAEVALRKEGRHLHQAFFDLGCPLICWSYVQTFLSWRKLRRSHTTPFMLVSKDGKLETAFELSHSISVA